MKRAFPLVFLSMLLVVACGGGGSDPVTNSGGGGSSNTIAASFTPTQPNPTGPNEVSMSQGARNANLVTVRVEVTDTNDVFGASFEIDYDVSSIQFEGWSAGTILESGGNNPNYTVNATNGMVVVGASRTGNASGVNVNGTQTLINLTFRVTDTGTMPIQFINPVLSDNQLQPQPLFGISWSAGDLVGTRN
jgi:hypothetical protein